MCKVKLKKIFLEENEPTATEILLNVICYIYIKVRERTEHEENCMNYNCPEEIIILY